MMNDSAAAIPAMPDATPDGELDNPIWASLRARHRALAIGNDDVLRFPADHAPFAAVRDASIDAAGITKLLVLGESVYMIGVAPDTSSGSITSFQPLAQMTCASRIEAFDGPEIQPLGEAHRADVLELTALVYPHYFRPRTMHMGRYFGIYLDGRLAAMIGERLGTGRCQEISAICTHPDFAGRGFARRLLASLSNDLLDRKRLPFLHVSYENARALRMYESVGYRVRRDIEFWQVRRDE